MDPNKIHIDELVRQRLQGGEEEPRPGAWLSMRDLLDKQMPVGSRPAGGLAWGNAARWTTALVLLTLLAGGYGAMDIRRVSHETLAVNSASQKRVMISAPAATTSGENSVSSNTVGNTNAVSTTTGVKAVGAQSDGQSRTTGNAVATFSGANYSSNIGASNRADRSGQQVAIDASTSRFSQEKVGGRRSGSKATTDGALASNMESRLGSKAYSKTAFGSSKKIESATNTAGSTSGVAKTDNASAKQDDSKTESRATKSVASGKRSRKSARQASRERANAESNAASANVERTTKSQGSRVARGGGVLPVDGADSLKKVPMTRDTLHQIRIAQRYIGARGVGGGHYVADTLPAVPYIIERPLPTIASAEPAAPARVRRNLLGRKRNAETSSPAAADPATAAAASPAIASADKKTVTKSQSSPVVNPSASQSLAAAPSLAAAAAVEMVPLSSRKVSSTTNTKLQYSAQEQIQDVMRRTQFLFGQMRLYSGVTGGFNASVAGTSMGGFHAGLFGLLAINDHWSAGIEGKFVQRFNRGTELHDPYYHYRATTFDRFTNPSGDAYNVYRVTQDSFDHYYKLSTIETVEFPIYARYSFKRFHAFGGANLTYGLRVNNIERVERFAGRESSGMDTVLASVQYAPPTNTAASVKLADFGPRFGLGYTAGVGYQASPAVLVDLRITQLVWDNRSAGAGGLRVSQTFYRVPSLQLSIGYRFSQMRRR